MPPPARRHHQLTLRRHRVGRVTSHRIKRALRTVSVEPKWSAEDFDAEYYAHQQRARQRLQKRRRRPGSAAAQARFAALSPFLRETIERYVARARACRIGSRDRLRDGFRWPGGYVNGQPIAPFIEHGLRSPLHPMLRLFVAGTRRAQCGLRAGDSKERLLGWGSKPSHGCRSIRSISPIRARVTSRSARG